MTSLLPPPSASTSVELPGQTCAIGVGPTGHWSIHQLTEFFAAVSVMADIEHAMRVATERATECLDAELGMFVLEGHPTVEVGFGRRQVPTQVLELTSGAHRLEVAGLGSVELFVADLVTAGDHEVSLPGRLLVGRAGDGFDAEEVQMVTAMAITAGLVLRNLRALDAERARHLMLSRLLDIQRAISTRRPLMEILDHVTKAATGLLGVGSSCLVLLDGERRPEVVAHRGSPDIQADPLHNDLLAVAAAQGAIATQELTGFDSTHIPDEPEIVAVPVHVEGVASGALVVWRQGWGAATDLHGELLAMFAQQISVALNDAYSASKVEAALHDSLTGLPSRALFMDRLDHACSVARRSSRTLTLLFIDLDHFKAVNDTWGHLVGDELLAQVGQRLRCVLRDSDTAGRLGGDEFVVLLEGIAEGGADAVARSILTVLAAPFDLTGCRVSVTASIGVAQAFGGGLVAERLLRSSDSAMYLAKRDGRGRVSTTATR